MLKGIDYLLNGGPIMYPLFACAIIAIAVMIERFIVITRAGADNEGLSEQVRALITQGRVAEALKLCEDTPGPIPGLLANGIRNRDMDSDGIERQMEELAMRETPILYRRLGVLDTIITIAPLLGLLGTVTGMIRSFHVVGAASGMNNVAGVSGGVAEALIATATGLAIAIVTLIGYNYLTEQVKQVIADMEVRATQMMNILAGVRGTEGRRGEVAAARA